MAAEWTTDTAASAPRLPPTTAQLVPQVAAAANPSEGGPHDLWRNVKRGWCRKCGIGSKLHLIQNDHSGRLDKASLGTVVYNQGETCDYIL